MKLSVEVISFINGLLQFYPEKRFDWEQIKNHPFIKNDVTTFHFIDLKTVKEGDAKNLELKDINVKYDRKLDSTSYFIDNNIQQFRLDLKNEITKFDNEIKSMMSELNNETLNTYNEDTFAAIDFLEENSLKIKKNENQS